MSDKINHIEAILCAWDVMDNAAQGVATALPQQMTQAAERLECARIQTRNVIQHAALMLSK